MQKKENLTLSGKINAVVSCKTSQGEEISAPAQRLTRHRVLFEIDDPNCALTTSEVVENFQIKLNDRAIYAGRAVIANLINTGGTVICEASLDHIGLDRAAFSTVKSGPELTKAFDEFLTSWGKNYKIRPDFKILLTDMHSYLSDLRRWLDAVELGLDTSTPEGVQTEREVIQQLMSANTPALGALFEKFEELALQIPEELRAAHQDFCRQLLHPLILCSPFMNRIYTKPLGYAGDYEMVNMILRDPVEGGSLFAKLLNVFILSQAPATAHRNRVIFLTQKLVEETNRAVQKGKKLRVLNIACGPAGEMQNFIRDHFLSDSADVTLLDSNDETLAYTRRMLETGRQKYHRRTQLHWIKQSVYHLIKQSSSRAQSNGAPAEYDFIYCAGLFDYLNDGACQALMELFYRQLVPGGLLLATNVDSCNPIRNIMEYIFEWHLIYRNGREFAALAPRQADPDRTLVQADVTSSNIFIEVRKPLNNS